MKTIFRHVITATLVLSMSSAYGLNRNLLDSPSVNTGMGGKVHSRPLIPGISKFPSLFVLENQLGLFMLIFQV